MWLAHSNEMMIVLIILMGLMMITVEATAAARPNVVIMMADDMGFDDISFRGSNKYLTPNIDALAYSGVILKNLYVPAMCTPSRAALLTGKYPINTGMQHYVIPNDQPWSLPTNESTMAQIFRQAGYHTNLIGKWHLGMSRKAYTPTLRGFDHHYGYLGAYIDYWDQTLYNPQKNYSRGHDFRDDLQVTREHVGTYVTDLLTDEALRVISSHRTSVQPLFLLLSHLAPHSGNDDAPLQAPAAEVEKFAYIKNKDERIYAAMMSMLDNSVARVIDALAAKDMLQNTIIMFLSDNGGPTLGMHSTGASNYPLRGQKNSPWEGGIRSSAVIWSTQLENLGTVWQQRIYIADLLPTLAAASFITLDTELKLDGLNLWPALKYGYESLEREIVHNIDDESAFYAYSLGKWKLLQGTTEQGDYDGWYGERPSTQDEMDPRSQVYEETVRVTSVWQTLSPFNSNGNILNITELRAETGVLCPLPAETTSPTSCMPLTQPCLFDIDVDPCERNNLYAQYKSAKFLQDMLARVQYFREHAQKPNNRPTDPKCDPKYFDGEWTWWEEERENGGSGETGGDGDGVAVIASFSYRILFMIVLMITF